MKQTSKLATGVLALAGVALAQSQADVKKAGYLRNAELASQQYAACTAENSKLYEAPACDTFLNAAAYYKGMAAAVTDTGDVPGAIQQKLANQRDTADAKASYLRSAKLAREHYDTCLQDHTVPEQALACQRYVNQIAYNNAMAAAVTDTGVVPEATRRQLMNQLRDADRKAEYLRSAQLARDNYNRCLKAPNGTATSCERYLYLVKEYEASAASITAPLPK